MTSVAKDWADAVDGSEGSDGIEIRTPGRSPVSKPIPKRGIGIGRPDQTDEDGFLGSASHGLINATCDDLRRSPLVLERNVSTATTDE